jgi:hypothetical protein
MARKFIPKKQKKKGVDRSQVAKQIWQEKARVVKLRRGWITVNKKGQVVIIPPHLHEYPHGKEKPKGAGVSKKSDEVMGKERMAKQLACMLRH